MLRTLALAVALALAPAAFAGGLDLGYVPAPAAGQSPAFLVTANQALDTLTVVIVAGDDTHEFVKRNVSAGSNLRFEFPRRSGVTSATAWLTIEYADGNWGEMKVPFEWSYGGKLSVDLSNADADVKRRVLTVSTTAYVETADVIVYGANKTELARQTVDIGQGPGDVEVPWIGDAHDAVLLEVTLKNSGGWAGFTYSPWFHPVDHADVHFDTNEAVILEGEEWKMKDTLEKVQAAYDKYGSVVKVRLYIAGCTDTVGSSESNIGLSLRRARAIGVWLRDHGYKGEIYYHGFGESLLAEPTGDNVDEVKNRRALYVLGANPPPPSSGIPKTAWTKL